MTKYEFKLLERPILKIESALNEAGLEGWDVVSYVEINAGVSRLILRREIEQKFMAGV